MFTYTEVDIDRIKKDPFKAYPGFKLVKKVRDVYLNFAELCIQKEKEDGAKTSDSSTKAEFIKATEALYQLKKHIDKFIGVAEEGDGVAAVELPEEVLGFVDAELFAMGFLCNDASLFKGHIE